MNIVELNERVEKLKALLSAQKGETAQSIQELKEILSDNEWLGVLMGWALGDYIRDRLGVSFMELEELDF